MHITSILFFIYFVYTCTNEQKPDYSVPARLHLLVLLPHCQSVTTIKMIKNFVLQRI